MREAFRDHVQKLGKKAERETYLGGFRERGKIIKRQESSRSSNLWGKGILFIYDWLNIRMVRGPFPHTPMPYSFLYISVFDVCDQKGMGKIFEAIDWSYFYSRIW